MNHTSKTSLSIRCMKLLLVVGWIGSIFSACADDRVTSSNDGFSITGIIPLESFYDCYTLTRLELPGIGFEAGDLVQFIDTGVSHNTYTLQTDRSDEGLTVTLPVGSFAVPWSDSVTLPTHSVQ